MSQDALPLVVKDLSVQYGGREGTRAVSDVSLMIRRGEMRGLIGESGSGKSSVASAIMGLLPRKAEVSAQEISVSGNSLIGIDFSKLNDLRGKDMGMVFQDPMSTLNPVVKIGEQIVESLFVHEHISKTEGNKRAIELLKAVQIPDPELRVNQYPHQLSGGMRQRVAIASAIASQPSLILADEPTTALDVIVQDQVLQVLDNLRRVMQIGILLISHDLGVVSNYCDHVYVMYHSKIVEEGPTEEVLSHPRHPYTQALIQCLPDIAGKPREHLTTIQDVFDESGADFPSISSEHQRTPDYETVRYAQQHPIAKGDEHDE